MKAQQADKDATPSGLKALLDVGSQEDHPCGWIPTAMMVVVLHVVPGAQPYSHRPFIDSKEITIRQAFRFFVC